MFSRQRVSIIVVLVLASPMSLASDISISELKAKVEAKKSEYYAGSSELSETKIAIEKKHSNYQEQMKYLDSLARKIEVVKKPLTKEEKYFSELSELRKKGEEINKIHLKYKEQEKHLSYLQMQIDALSAEVCKLGPIAGEVPTTVLFNKNLKFPQEKIMLYDYIWECANYNSDGTCSKVQAIKCVY